MPTESLYLVEKEGNAPTTMGGYSLGGGQQRGPGPDTAGVVMPYGWDSWSYEQQESWVESLQESAAVMAEWMETGLLWGTPWNPYREEIVDTVETVVVASSAAAIAGAVAVGVVALLAAAVWFDVK